MKRQPDHSQDYDILIDGAKFTIESIPELTDLVKRSQKFQGINLNRDRKKIAERIWWGMAPLEAEKFERSKNNFGLNFPALKAKGAE